MSFRGLVPIVQRFPSHAILDIGAAVREELAARDIGGNLPDGSRVAIAVGSRGVANLAQVLRASVGHFLHRRLKPFIVPAMGSHGGGTAEGQTGILAKYGVTEAAAGCAIVSSMETISLGKTADGIETFFDKAAFASDGVFVINRVKWHTTFEAPIESGLCKMLAVGLGKVAGATRYHQHAVRAGLGAVVRSVARQVLASGKVLGGLALVEDAHHQTGRVAAMAAADLEREEEQLLVLARSWMARIPFDEVDVLIVDEIGKQISGTGMDSKIVNRHPHGAVNPWPWAPRIMRIYLRDLSEVSYGNATGIGMADLISERLYRKIDWNAMKVNGLAASNFTVMRTPLRAANDREALGLLANASGRADVADVTTVRIRNTLELARMEVSENLLAKAHAGVEIAGPRAPYVFDEKGNL